MQHIQPWAVLCYGKLQWPIQAVCNRHAVYLLPIAGRYVPHVQASCTQFCTVRRHVLLYMQLARKLCMLGCTYPIHVSSGPRTLLLLLLGRGGWQQGQVVLGSIFLIVRALGW